MAELPHPQPPVPKLPSYSLFQELQIEQAPRLGLKVGKQVEVHMTWFLASEEGVLAKVVFLQLLQPLPKNLLAVLVALWVFYNITDIAESFRSNCFEISSKDAEDAIAA